MSAALQLVKPGYYATRQVNDRRAYISRAKIDKVLDAPEYFFARYGENLKEEDTDARRWARMLHQAVLEPRKHQANRVVCRYDNFRTAEARAWKERTLLERPGAQILNTEQCFEIDRMVERIRTHKVAGSLLATAQKEHHGYAVDPETGLLLYTIPDLVTDHDEVGDLKFIGSADPFEFNRMQYKERWFMQLAFYNYVHELITGKKRRGNTFYIAVEQAYPHRLEVITLDAKYEEMGEHLFRQGLNELKELLDQDPTITNFEVWRSRSNKPKQIEPEYFMLNNDPRFQHLLGLGA